MTVYALLVGIDVYAAARSLSGCVQDVARMEDFIKARVKSEELADPKILLNEAATREAIIDGFTAYLSQAGDGDVVLFYFCGHGSQEIAPPEFWNVEPDKKNETIVCHDSRTTSTAWDLADKELAYLIQNITAGKDIHTVVILDSCHSGSATRDADMEHVRLIPADTRVRPLDSYLIRQPPAGAQIDDNWYTPPQGKHILMAACRPEEVARERIMGREQQMQGVFSYFLREALTNSGPDLTYRDLFKHVSAMVRLTITNQTPQIETREQNLNQRFLGGDVMQPRTRIFSVSFDRDTKGFVIDGGTVHGIGAPVVEEDHIESTRLAVFPKDSAQFDMHNALGLTAVLDALPTTSKVADILTPRAGDNAAALITLDKNDTYKAVVIASPLPRVLVRLSGKREALKLVREALGQANYGEPSMFVRIAESKAEVQQAQLGLIAVDTDQVYRISRAQDALSLFVDTPYSRPRSAEIAVQQLEQMARWMRLYELSNPVSQIKSNDVTLTVTSVDRDGQESPVETANVVQLQYRQIGEQLEKPGLKIVINNHTHKSMYAALVNIAPSFRVWPVALSGTLGTVKVDPFTSVLVAEGRRITVGIPDSLPDTVTQVNDLFKLIVSTNEFDATILAEESLPVQFREQAKATSTLRSSNLIDSLASILGRISSRDAGFDDVDILCDWRTVDLNITTSRPQTTVAITPGAREIVLGEGITLVNDAGLTATARLMTDPESGRDVGNLAVPPLLREDPPRHSMPFSLAHTRSGEPGLSILDLSEITNPENVTRDTPLRLHIPVPIRENEHLLAYGFDGEFYLPLGWVTNRLGGAEITIERLPDPEPSRTLINSVRIYFQKITVDTLGLESKYPRLAAVQKIDDEFVYEDDPQQVTARVSKAKHILLYIHGILGETRFMVPSAWEGEPGRRIADKYDLILAFDYENLATGIKKVAEELQAKLTDVNLPPGHDKNLDVVAHSMGGLVAGWLIEHIDGGNQTVHKLILCGTPNGGSPWPKIEDYVFSLLIIALNTVAPVTWPVAIVAGLLTFIEKQAKMLDEMAVSSDLIEDLARGRDPQLPYISIAGNTSIIEAARQALNGQPSAIERLLRRLNLHNVAGLAFFNEPNDVAVSVKSVFAVPGHWSPAQIKHEVACDHMTYFEAQGGLPALRMVLT